jgi:predicted AlkP superfamily phosphohydrolase/phosphomutase
MDGRKKLYIIGVDSAPLWIIKDLQKQYRLSGFTKFLDEGVLMDMESTMPPMTGPSWPSIYTGFRPGAHGVPEFLKMERNYTKSVVYYDTRIKAPFWDVMAKQGYKCLVVTPAMLVKPSDEPNVDMITGFPLPAKFSSKRIRDIAGKHGFSGEPEIEKEMKSGELSLKDSASIYLGGGTKKRIAVSKELIDGGDYDLAFICFTEQDRMQHFSLNKPEWKDLVMPFYEEISDFLLWVHARAEKEGAEVMVISDHGAQPIDEKFITNGWMINNGFIKLDESIEKSMRKNGGGKIKYSMREKLLKTTLRKKVYDKLPKIGKNVVKTIVKKGLSGTSEGDYMRIHDFDFDMGKTLAFASIANCPVCTIYINDSRFDKGIVKQEEKQALKQKIREELMKVKNDKEEQIILETWDADGYYEGTNLFIAPDVFAEIRPGYIMDAFGFLKSGKLFIKPEPAKCGDHLRNGIFGILNYGNRIDYAAIARQKLYVYNVAPTVFKLFGIKHDTDPRYGPIV